MDTLNVALIGVGRIGRVHLKNLFSMAHVRVKYCVDALVDETKAALTQVTGATAAQGPVVTDSVATALLDADVHAVLITTPTASHVQLISQALNSGKHVFCEKPISFSVQEVDDMYAVAAEKGLRLLCGYQRRYDPSFRQVCESARSGAVGDVQMIRSCSRDHPVPTPAYLAISGGLMHDCGSHDFDLVHWASGSRPTTVSACGSASIPEIAALNDVDNALVMFSFCPDPTLACVDLNRNAAYGYDQRLEVLGHKGMLVCENQPEHSTTKWTAENVSSSVLKHSFPQRYVDAYRLEIEHFIDAVRNPAVDLRVTHDDARVAAILAGAADEALKGCKIVEIDYNQGSGDPKAQTPAAKKRKK